jgi:hypothetical protein
MDKNLPLLIGLLFITTLILGGAVGYLAGYEHGSQDEITSFEECVAAGNPIMESYPEQCRTKDGKHFTRILETQ